MIFNAIIAFHTKGSETDTALTLVQMKSQHQTTALRPLFDDKQISYLAPRLPFALSAFFSSHSHYSSYTFVSLIAKNSISVYI